MESNLFMDGLPGFTWNLKMGGCSMVMAQITRWYPLVKRSHGKSPFLSSVNHHFHPFLWAIVHSYVK